MVKTAIILAGGRGLRLGLLTEQTPKPLLIVAGRPFIFHILDYALKQGIERVVIATGYLAEQFERTIGHRYRGLSILYSNEGVPLGTGGAIALAMKKVPEPAAVVLNGDTFFPVDLSSLFSVYLNLRAGMVMALRHVNDASRYGAVNLENGWVSSLREKGVAGPGNINGGVYLLSVSVFQRDAERDAFSLETDMLPQWIKKSMVAGLVSNAYFIDIGVPADFERAQQDLRW